MAKYSGSGWHFQSIRHSNARKYGKAGGTYAKRYVLIGKSQGQTRILGSFKKRIDAETKEGILGFEPTDEKVEYKIKEYTPKRKAGWYDIGHSHYGKTERKPIAIHFDSAFSGTEIVDVDVNGEWVKTRYFYPQKDKTIKGRVVKRKMNIDNEGVATFKIDKEKYSLNDFMKTGE